MTADTENSLTPKEQLFEMLRREIFAAQVKVALDRELGRPTSSKVKKLAAVKMPARVAKPKWAGAETDQGLRGLSRKEQLFRQLRREILAARLKVTLDRELGRETSPAVRSLAGMTLPPLVKQYGRGRGVIEHGE